MIWERSANKNEFSPGVFPWLRCREKCNHFPLCLVPIPAEMFHLVARVVASSYPIRASLTMSLSAPSTTIMNIEPVKVAPNNRGFLHSWWAIGSKNGARQRNQPRTLALKPLMLIPTGLNQRRLCELKSAIMMTNAVIYHRRIGPMKETNWDYVFQANQIL